MKTRFLCGRFFAVALSALLLSLGGALQAAAPGFFQLRQIEGRWWFLDPNGKPFLSKGVTTVSFYQDWVQHTITSPYGEATRTKYGTVEKWRKAVAQRLLGWNFNTLGSWSDEAISQVDAGGGRYLAYSVTLNFVERFAAHNNQPGAWQHGIFPDIFAPEFLNFCNQTALELCAPRKLDTHLLGWFTDNELRWGADWRGKEELLTLFLNLPAGQAGRTAAIDLLRKRYPDFAAFNAVWKTRAKSWEELASVQIDAPFTRSQALAQNQEVERGVEGTAKAFVADCDAFLSDLAERYFSATDAAIKTTDPNHLNFGCRFAYFPAQAVVTAAARHLDAISFNCYSADPSSAIDRYSAFGKPVLIGEFSFRAMESGLPNTKGAGPKVPTQKDRAAGFESYVTLALSKPNLVGYHWFEHADEPKEGRFDGENSNYGVVDIHDNPYEELTQKMTEINGRAETLHRGGQPQ